MKSYYKNSLNSFNLYHGDNIKIIPKLNKLNIKFNMVFSDPPYFLSNDGLSINSGKIVSVNKGNWDKSTDINYINNFNYKWLKLIRDVMFDNATIWISSTQHNLFSIGQVLNQLDFKILNIITWEKTNPPPNFSCRYFTHSAEYIIWARKQHKTAHIYNYDLMKEFNADKQMKDVWRLPAIAPWEKTCGKHPTQKPLALLARIILASTNKGDLILDPFTGSSSTGIAANLFGRKFIGIDSDKNFLEISKNRHLELNNPEIMHNLKNKVLSKIKN